MDQGGSLINIIINTDSNEPIYEQIENQIKKKIIDNELQTGDSLPSMRSLARNLKVAVITVQRAYEDLQKEGFIETVHGKGSFVSARNVELFKEENYAEIEELAKKMIKISKTSSLSLDNLINLIKNIYEEDI
ncbi:GntR family transcriptional regulator [Anaerosalibacter sp. Marseille-P3206]|uniref:GntR family transcriptional regulator n=1 Tax=Anaerosalibacter sp. Marseille-P3206 TaxID=1871005 RepID=UPI0009861759|nr:GntR family transcriptional regulator [Anaerosalibacter sp. Marseille-P3206]